MFARDDATAAGRRPTAGRRPSVTTAARAQRLNWKSRERSIRRVGAGSGLAGSAGSTGADVVFVDAGAVSIIELGRAVQARWWFRAHHRADVIASG